MVPSANDFPLLIAKVWALCSAASGIAPPRLCAAFMIIVLPLSLSCRYHRPAGIIVLPVRTEAKIARLGGVRPWHAGHGARASPSAAGEYPQPVGWSTWPAARRASRRQRERQAGGLLQLAAGSPSAPLLGGAAPGEQARKRKSPSPLAVGAASPCSQPERRPRDARHALARGRAAFPCAGSGSCVGEAAGGRAEPAAVLGNVAVAIE